MESTTNLFNKTCLLSSVPGLFQAFFIIISLSFSDANGKECTYFSVEFSKQCSFAKLSCDGPSIPIIYFINLKNNLLKTLRNNSDVKEMLKKRDLPQLKYYTIRSNGVEIPVKESRPADFDETKKYPVLLDVYGGPGTQKVRNNQ